MLYIRLLFFRECGLDLVINGESAGGKGSYFVEEDSVDVFRFW